MPRFDSMDQEHRENIPFLPHPRANGQLSELVRVARYVNKVERNERPRPWQLGARNWIVSDGLALGMSLVHAKTPKLDDGGIWPRTRSSCPATMEAACRADAYGLGRDSAIEHTSVGTGLHRRETEWVPDMARAPRKGVARVVERDAASCAPLSSLHGRPDSRGWRQGVDLTRPRIRDDTACDDRITGISARPRPLRIGAPN